VLQSMSVDGLGYGYYVVDTLGDSGGARAEDGGDRVSFPVVDGPYVSEGAARQHSLAPGLVVTKTKVPQSDAFK